MQRCQFLNDKLLEVVEVQDKMVKEFRGQMAEFVRRLQRMDNYYTNLETRLSMLESEYEQ